MKRITIALALLLFASGLAHGQAGYLDKTFGDGGALRLPNYYPDDICVLPDGKIVITGKTSKDNNYGLNVTKYTDNGKTDVSFGSAGTLYYPARYVLKSTICRQPDDKLLVYGGIQLNDNQPINGYVLRIFADGTIDSSFGNNGLYFDKGYVETSYLHSLQLQTDGSMLGVGVAYSAVSLASVPQMFITRITTDGKRDTHFGTSGRVMIGAIQDTGEVIDVLITRSGSIFVAFAHPKSKRPDLHILKCDINGVLDPSFADSGVLRMRLSDAKDLLKSIVETEDGKLVCLSWMTTDRGNRSVLFRLTKNGVLDESFGDYGTVTPLIASDNIYFNRCIIDSDGKLFTFGIYYGQGSEYTFCTARFHENGKSDSTYGVQGVGTGYPEHIADEKMAAVDNNGKYLINAYYYRDSVQGGLIYRVNNTRMSNVLITEAASTPISLHPTPSLDICTVTYTLPSSGECTMTLRDESGREVRTFATNQYRTAGEHKEELDLRGLAAGVYFLQIETNGTSQTAKLIKQ